MTREEKFYVAEPVRDELGKGFRLFSHEDDVYESRSAGNHESRLYGNDGDWQAKVRLPIADNSEAYETFKDIARTIEEEYGIDLLVDAHSFNEHVTNTGVAVISEDNTYLRYNEETSLSVKGEKDAGAKALFGTLGGYVVTGATTGGALAAPGGPAGIATGATLGGLTGVCGALFDFLGVLVTEDFFDDKTVTPSLFVGELNKRRHRNKYLKGKVIKPRRLRGQPELVKKLNTLNHAERVIDETQQLELDEEYNALREAEVDKLFDIALTTYFDSMERLQGVQTGKQFDDYEDAASFIALVQDAELDGVERPSIYQSPDIFRNLFSNFVYENDGEERVLTEGEELIDNVFDEDAEPAIDEFLQTEYPELYDDVGMRGLP